MSECELFKGDHIHKRLVRVWREIHKQSSYLSETSYMYTLFTGLHESYVTQQCAH